MRVYYESYENAILTEVTRKMFQPDALLTLSEDKDKEG